MRLRFIGGLGFLLLAAACAGGSNSSLPNAPVPNLPQSVSAAASGDRSTTFTTAGSENVVNPFASPAPVYINATPTAKSLPVKVTGLPTPAQITIEASITCNSSTSGSTIMAYISSWQFSAGLCNGATNPKTSAGLNLYDQGTGKQVFPANGLASATTYFVAGVHEGSNLTYYVCAYPKGACQVTALADAGKLTYSGTTANIGTGFDGVSRRMAGDIWDLSLYAVALSPAQIQAQANAMRSDPYPVASPTPFYTNATPTANTLPVKVTGLPTPAQMTIEASVKCNSSTSGSTIMAYISSWQFSAGQCNAATNLKTAAGLNFYDQGTGKQVFPVNGLASATTYFVAGVHDGTNLTYYVCAYPKGTCQASALADAGKLTYSGTTANIGTGFDGVSRPMAGDIWDLSLYGAALSPAQIQAQANAMRSDPYPTPTPNPCLSGSAGLNGGLAAGRAQQPSIFTAADPRTGHLYHKMLPPKVFRENSAAIGASSSVDLSCHGGPIQTAPKAYAVFWGADWNDTSSTGGDPNGMRARALAWLKAMAASGWKNTDTQYVNSLGVHVGNGSALFGGEFDDPSSTVPTIPQFSDLANEASVAASHFGDYSVNANYVVFTTINHKPADFGTQYCAWHSYMSAGGNTVPFTNMPYVADPTQFCGSYSVNPAPGGITDGLSIVLGHEQAETETDPLLNAWYDAAGQETGDKCAWYQLQDNPNAGGFPTQPLWSNASSNCVQNY